MTTQTTTPTGRVTVAGYLDAIGVKGNKTTYSVKKNPKRDFPDWYVGYFANENDEGAPRLTTGAWYRMLCDTKDGGLSQKTGRPITYYNLVQATPISEAEAYSAASTPVAPTARPKAAAPAPGPSAGQREPLPFDDSPFQEEEMPTGQPAPRAPLHVDRDESIWRSVSLQQAVAWAAIPSTAAVPTVYDVTEKAAVFLKFLRSGVGIPDPQAQEDSAS